MLPSEIFATDSKRFWLSKSIATNPASLRSDHDGQSA